MDKEFIPYEQALALKELGYNNGSFACVLGDGFNIFDTMVHYNTNPKFPEYYDVPLYQQAFRWFREKHKLFGEINLTTKQEDVEAFEFFILTGDECLFEDSKDYNTYEEAELECLKKLIEIVK